MPLQCRAAVALTMACVAATLIACEREAAEEASLPVRSAPTAPIALPTREPLAPPAARPEPPALPTPVPTAPLDPTAATAASYRAWMEEARLLHPYAESLEQMWAVMLCESSGNAGVIAGPYHGLFQYSAETWFGDWNPYREQPILDPRAQIFATAKAWQDGRQGWWGCY